MIPNHSLPGGFSSRSRGSKRGQTLVEYALILALISVVAISVLMSLGTQVKGVFTTISSQLAIAGSGGSAAATPAPPPRGG